MNRWILLIHQIAQDAPSLRIKIWRDLKKHGAVLFKNAVYILPSTAGHEEIMQWLCRQIKEKGGTASLFITESLDKKQDGEIIQTFHEVCDKEYLDLMGSCDDVLARMMQREETEDVTDILINDFNKSLNEITKRFEAVARIDFFDAPQKKGVLKKTQAIRQKLDGWRKTQKREVPVIYKVYQTKVFAGKTWATRKDIYIDRMASAWLIRRFIDPKAQFVFLPKSADKAPKDTIPFDMYGAEFTHHGEDCTFETLMKIFCLKDAALQPIAEIVHDIDLKDNKYGRTEAEGIDQIINGLSQRLRHDNTLLEKGLEIFDALYQYYSSKNERR